jgi:para-aminobenzoate synthetase component I
MSFAEELNILGSAGIPFFFMIDFEEQCPKVFPLGALPEDLYFKTALFSKHPAKRTFINPVSFKKYPIKFSEYKQSFLKVKKALKKGESYLLNLTFQTPIKTNIGLTETYMRSASPYKLLFNNQFVSFSPESFIKIKEGKIYTFPMKGTIDANLPKAEKQILLDKKEIAEHNTIVDLLRNDISMVAKKVNVEKLRYIDTIKTNTKTLLQVSSKISGVLPKDYPKKIGDIITKLLPAGSISGAPKRETLNIIRQTENNKRGYYTGVMGVFDGENLDSAVLIRFIENINGQLVYKSGGGITFLSNAESEYQELIDKIYVSFN